MVGVCLTPDERGHAVNQWSYALSHFAIDRVFLLGEPVDDDWFRMLPTRAAKVVDSVRELPGRVVMLTPEHGRYLPGTTSLVDYTHPESATYVVGSNHRYPPADLLDGVEADRVFIPTATAHDMYGWTALCVALYDRLKRG